MNGFWILYRIAYKMLYFIHYTISNELFSKSIYRTIKGSQKKAEA